MEKSKLSFNDQIGLTSLLLVFGWVISVLLAVQYNHIDAILPISLAFLAGFWTLWFSITSYRYVKPLFYLLNMWLKEDGQRDLVELDFGTPIPDHLLEMADKIKQWGFTRLGVQKLTLQNSETRIFWQWVDETGTILAMVCEPSDSKPFVAFETYFLDGFQLGTFYEHPVELDTKHVWWQNLNSSIGDAHDYHMYQFDQKSAIYGQAKTYETLADTIDSDEVQKQHYRWITQAHIQALLPHILHYSIGIVGFLIATVLAFLNENGAFIFFWITMVVLFISGRITGRNKPQQRKSRKAVEQ